LWKSSARSYPKGYIEILERQHQQLVSSLRILHSKLLGTSPWNVLFWNQGQEKPSTHDILATLGPIDAPLDDDQSLETFEGSVTKTLITAPLGASGRTNQGWEFDFNIEDQFRCATPVPTNDHTRVPNNAISTSGTEQLWPLVAKDDSVRARAFQPMLPWPSYSVQMRRNASMGTPLLQMPRFVSDLDKTASTLDSEHYHVITASGVI